MSIERRRLTQEVAAALQQQIVQLELPPGHRLPSHAELAEQLSISVPSLREGLQILAALGIVRLEHGRGTIVGRPSITDYLGSVDPSLLSRSYSPDDCVSLIISCVEPAIERLCELHRRHTLLDRPIAALRRPADAADAAGALRGFYQELLAPLRRQLTSEVVQLAVKLLISRPNRAESLVRISEELAASLQSFADALRRGDTDAARRLLGNQRSTLDSLVPSDDRLVCATGSIGGTFYSGGLELASALQGRHGLTLRLMPTAGGIENLRLIERGEADVAFTQAYVARAAVEGRAPFDHSSSDVRVLCRTHSLDLWIVTTEASRVVNLRSLEGARLSIGTRAGYTSTISELLLSLYGQERAAEQLYLSISQATEALARGEVEVLFYLTGGMGTAISQLAESVPLRVLSIDEDVVQSLCRREAGLSPSTIRDESGREIARTIRVETLFISRADLGEAKASALWDAICHAASSSDILDPSIPADDGELGPLTLHPGVVRYAR